MLAFEVMLLMIVGVITIVTVAAVGRPLAEAYSEKLKTRYREIGSDKEYALTKRVEELERELLDLRGQMKEIQQSTEFAIKMIEDKGRS